MIKTIYRRHRYFFNMTAVLVLIIIVRILDWIGWAPNTPERIRNILFEHLFEFISFLPLIIMMIYSFRWAMKKSKKVYLYSVVVLFILLGPSLFLSLTTMLEKLFFSDQVLPITFDFLAKYSPGASLIIMFTSSAFYLTHLIDQSGKQKENAHRAETLAKDVQLKMLRYQINPHFLFNVLNSIYTLIDENTEKAKKLVIDMSEYYRYTLTKQQQTVSIEKEIESIMKYLEIQKTRFEEEFQYEISVDESVKQVLIPSFLIHLLIENAVKYGTKTAKHKLIIRLTVILLDKTLIIRVLNTGKIVSSTPNNEKNADGTSNGIENLKNRLALYYKDEFSFSLKEEDGWVVATIEIKNLNMR